MMELAQQLGVGLSWGGFGHNGEYDGDRRAALAGDASRGGGVAEPLAAVWERTGAADRRRRAGARAAGRAAPRLPDYMVPSAFVALDVAADAERQARPQGAAGAGAAAARATARRARRARRCWRGSGRELLALERVGVDDNFFELGGHSLLAMRVTARLREAFAIELPLRAVFEAPTVAELAAQVEELRRAGSGTALPPLRASVRPAELSLSFAQERLWLLEQLEGLGTAYNIPVVVGLHGGLEIAALEQSLAAVVRRHEVLRTRFARVDGAPVQVIDPAVQLRLAVEDLSGVAARRRPAAVRRRLAAIVGTPFDLERGPLLRAAVLRLSAQEHIAIVVVHHIVSDGWSLGILLRELGDAVWGVGGGAAVAAAGACDPICGLCAVAARVAVGSGAGGSGRLLEGAVGGSAVGA